jgi:hypothetical protein
MVEHDEAWEELQEQIKEERREFEWHNTPDWTSAWYDTSAELN